MERVQQKLSTWKGQQRLLQLFDEVSREEEKDPYVDSDGKYDKDHELPSSESEESVSSSNWDVPTVSKKTKIVETKNL